MARSQSDLGERIMRVEGVLSDVESVGGSNPDEIAASLL